VREGSLSKTEGGKKEETRGGAEGGGGENLLSSSKKKKTAPGKLQTQGNQYKRGKKLWKRENAPLKKKKNWGKKSKRRAGKRGRTKLGTSGSKGGGGGTHFWGGGAQKVKKVFRYMVQKKRGLWVKGERASFEGGEKDHYFFYGKKKGGPARGRALPGFSTARGRNAIGRPKGKVSEGRKKGFSACKKAVIGRGSEEKKVCGKKRSGVNAEGDFQGGGEGTLVKREGKKRGL